MKTWQEEFPNRKVFCEPNSGYKVTDFEIPVVLEVWQFPGWRQGDPGREAEPNRLVGGRQTSCSVLFSWYH